jgi:hypothetical protein
LGIKTARLCMHKMSFAPVPRNRGFIGLSFG